MTLTHGSHGVLLRPKMMPNSYVIMAKMPAKMTYNSRVVTAENARMMLNSDVFKTENAKMTVKSNVHDPHRETKCSWPSPWDQMFMTLTVEIPKSSWPSPPEKWKVRDPPCFFRNPPGALNNDCSPKGGHRFFGRALNFSVTPPTSYKCYFPYYMPSTVYSQKKYNWHYITTIPLISQ